MSSPSQQTVDPPYDVPEYRSSGLRAPHRPLVPIPPDLLSGSGPVFGSDDVDPLDADLTAGPAGAAQGQRINVSGRLVGSDGRPVGGQLIEIWQCNAAGRYAHDADQHPAPLDPNFLGAGRCLTDEEGRYHFTTIRPGAHPWRNHFNAWRPAHIYFSVFGRTLAERLVTQMYFPGDPLLDFDPIFLSVQEDRARRRLIASLDWDTTEEQVALGYRFDIVLGGHLATPVEPVPMTPALTPAQTVGPFFRFGLGWLHGRELVPPESPDARVIRGRVLDGAGDPVHDAVVEIYQADAGGGYPTLWRGFGRCLTDGAGTYHFVTTRPGQTDEVQAPHIEVSVFARRLLQRCQTRIYFPDETGANASDPLLRAIADPDRTATLVAVREGQELRFDIQLQGERETVSFQW